MAAACQRACRGIDEHPHAGSAPLARRNRRVLVLRAQKNGAPGEVDAGERWGCLVQDRPSRFIAASATGRIGDDLVERAVTLTVTRTQGQSLTWCSDGWRGYAAILRRAYRQPLRSGKLGRPPPGGACRCALDADHQTSTGSMASCFPLRSVLPWARWSTHRERCILSGSTARCVIGSMP